MASDQPLRVEEIDSQGRPVRRSGTRRALAWLGRHPILVLATIALLVPLAFGLHWWYWPNYPTLRADNVESVEIWLRKYEPNTGFGPGYEQASTHVMTDDAALIQALLDAFRTAKRAEEHHCGNSGTIFIRQRDGTVEEVQILPGHDEAHYEYRLGSRINKIDREPILAALRAIGLSRVKTVPPS
jgi:hypothetical protein